MTAVDECFKAIKGRDTVMAKQNQRLAPLCSGIRNMSGIKGPLNDINMLPIAEEANVVASQIVENGTYIVPREEVMAF